MNILVVDNEGNGWPEGRPIRNGLMGCAKLRVDWDRISLCIRPLNHEGDCKPQTMDKMMLAECPVRAYEVPTEEYKRFPIADLSPTLHSARMRVFGWTMYEYTKRRWSTMRDLEKQI